MAILVRLGALAALLVQCSEGMVVGHSLGADPVLRLRGAGKGAVTKSKGGEEPILCRLKKGGGKWEVACRPSKVEAFKEGKIKKSELLVSDEPFQDFKKGDHAPKDKIEAAFGTVECAPNEPYMSFEPLPLDT
jgi:hypothetical protein